ncbi:MAG TPA: putative phosphothreonine lyase domain-containing protein [bacterium]|nr:putative phosphothreonine lyase domain-containing protein [bacterium]
MKKSKRSGPRMPTRHEIIKHRQQLVADPYVKASPSEVTDTPWIYARRQIGDYPEATERSGKWLIFTPVERIDETWAAIKAATEAGRLGDSSKVATMYPNPLNRNPSSRVVCVYTYDSTDEVDVHRVRDVLRELGFTQKLPYKTDRDTLKGNYQHTSHTRIGAYYE